MNDIDKSKEQLIEELESSRREVASLKLTKMAFDAYQELLRSLATIEKTATGTLMLRTMLLQTVTLSNKLTRAEESSLFLLDADGTVVDSILARGATIREQKQSIIGQVLDKGLAGWVFQHRQIGSIADTMTDERWFNLPLQPYKVRSALCVPILKGKRLLGILTLMHSQPEHFSPETANLMQMTAEQIAVVLDNARLYSELHQLQLELDSMKDSPHSSKKLSLLGVYIIDGKGQLMYANPQLAEVFGYKVSELASWRSLFNLVCDDHRDLFANQVNVCLQNPRKNLSCTFRGQHRDGKLLEVEIYGTRTKFYGRSSIIGVLRSMQLPHDTKASPPDGSPREQP